MPNWVDNRLEIIGDIEHVQEVVEAIKGEPYEDGKLSRIDFNKIIEMPKELSSNGGWCDWCCENWGTNRNAAFSYSEGDPENVIHYRTAWVPALPVIVKLSSSFTNVSLNFSYWDIPRGREGRFLIRNGEIIEESQWSPEYEQC
jgi:hypothetical protein